MKYNKPEVMVLASASNAVQSSTKSQIVQESGSPTGVLAATVNAYESDE